MQIWMNSALTQLTLRRQLARLRRQLALKFSSEIMTADTVNDPKYKDLVKKTS